MTGYFVIVDGLDGSGKGVVVDALKEYSEKQGKKIFDLREYCKENHRFPEPEELNGYDVIVSAEPTYCFVGEAIRKEIVRENSNIYSALTTAHAFALDREILYKKIIIPCLKQGKTIFQERGVITSLVYQPVQMERLSLHDIINLPGNKLAIHNAPHLLIITKVSPDVVMQRLSKREKKDTAIFEKLHFQRKIESRYESEWLKKLFEDFRSKVIYLDTNPPKSVEDTKQEAVRVFEEAKPSP